MPVLQGGPGRRGGRGPRWAQVIDVEVIRKVTEWALPGLAVPVLRDGHVRGAAAGRARGLGVLRAGAERRRGGAVLLRERAAGAGRAGHGHAARDRRSRRAGSIRPPPGWLRSWGRPGSTRRCSRRWPGEEVLAADETPVNVLDKAAPAGRGAAGERKKRTRRRRRQGRGRGAARADHPDPGRAADVAAGHRLPPQGPVAAGSRPRSPGYLITDGYTGYQHLLARLAGIQQCAQHVIRRCRAVTKLGPGSLQSWAGDIITILREAHQAVEDARARGGHRPGPAGPR